MHVQFIYQSIDDNWSDGWFRKTINHYFLFDILHVLKSMVAGYRVTKDFVKACTHAAVLQTLHQGACFLLKWEN